MWPMLLPSALPTGMRVQPGGKMEVSRGEEKGREWVLIVIVVASSSVFFSFDKKKCRKRAGTRRRERDREKKWEATRRVEEGYLL